MKSAMVATSPLRSGQVMSRMAEFFIRSHAADLLPKKDVARNVSIASFAQQIRRGVACYALMWLCSTAAHYFLRLFRISRAALAPDPPVSPVPGWVPLPQR